MFFGFNTDAKSNTIIQPQPTLQDGAMNTSLALLRSKTLDPATANLPESDLAPSAGSYVDIRDVGQAHVLATTTPDASNQRFLVSAGPFSWQKSRTSLLIQSPAVFKSELAS